MMPIKSYDHWAFLEEIEAPMWVDLTLEGKSKNQNICSYFDCSDDKWFYTYHPVHQTSSHDLKSEFSRLFEEAKALDFELLVYTIPKILTSVSRSRGRDFDNNKSKGIGQDFAMDKQVIVEELSSGSAATKWKPRPKPSFTDSKRILSSDPSLVSVATCLTGNAMLNVSATGSSPGGKEPADSRIGISHRQPHKPMLATSQTLGHSSRLLSDMRCLRKSCVISQQASRLEDNSRQRQSSGHHSSLNNSSVCSSLNPGFGAKSITNTTSFPRMTQAAMNKDKVSSVCSSTLIIQVEDASSNTRRVGKLYNDKPVHLKPSKPKILRPKVSLLQKKDECNTCLKPNKQECLAGTAGCKTVVAGK
ncbi:uncharacterized protein LOC111799046 isoform X1 [Cucurbita pepo subsp. pepo]|uniref:uncharacterized protein LOC111799046 isoform X1 n=2 Tax=Cucurbita pepo subsp. pepo TaxID=3664 RepID=UPI000C9D5BD0|nr:uncharacterized protein LOC111799046 isoform X1 [Cucurbita pepo subsp. pepo]XP_023538213.1 uncharacterized protein LOC111799046 isoform X1 [Cucurbita pepo subsp. pepo]XP_023538221.1 uncharacterized protein LOC111799046 isoform X1 [Cucurbita pepo subsp. pepo]